MARASELKFDVGTHGKTSGTLFRADEPIGATYILAHGAGTNRQHPLVVDLAKALAGRGGDVVTFNFLYSEAGKRMPDKVELLETCWHAAIAKVRAKTGFESSPLFVGGRSMGGRIATHITKGVALDGVIVVGYPLHPSGKPTVVRDEILAVDLPLLAVQGTRDEHGSAAELKKYLAKRSNTRVVAIEGADHSFGERYFDEAGAAIVKFIVATTKKKERRG